MRKAVLFFIIVAGFLPANAQENKWAISFTPALLTTSRIHYGLQAGVEYKIKSRLSLLTELAIKTGADKDSSSRNTHYFRIKPELRYLLSQRESILQPYAGIQFSYASRKWDNTSGGSYFTSKANADSSVSFDRAKISSPVLASSVQLGTLINMGPDFCLDLFMGMGVRVIDTKYSEVENPAKDRYFRSICKIMFSPDPAYWINGTVTRFHMNLGLRLVYRF